MSSGAVIARRVDDMQQGLTLHRRRWPQLALCCTPCSGPRESAESLHRAAALREPDPIDIDGTHLHAVSLQRACTPARKVQMTAGGGKLQSSSSRRCDSATNAPISRGIARRAHLDAQLGSLLQ